MKVFTLLREAIEGLFILVEKMELWFMRRKKPSAKVIKEIRRYYSR
ncbi:hypothetical protein [Thermospira aquatica]|uniref:Uncharacterized protein n=1 Tax=Thermospira aquatica TaxID=2828656 RepID=A0AAX3BDW9_9SPIR|nr:hypothetical protein [Thermospira aquatica]URA10522.1 hypothetical protein KDW03_01590 [Thermospira aquatica]